jgi:signal peptidase I
MPDRETIVDNLINIWQEKETIKILPSEGKSMYPLIKKGDRLNIKFTKPENIKRGDIAAFRRSNAIVVHRLIGKKGSTFIEKGDYHIKGTHIKADDIIGKIEIGNRNINNFMAIIGYVIYSLGIYAKPLLIIPFILNAGTRFYTKLRTA